MSDYQFIENTLAGNRQRGVDWTDMKVLFNERMRWSDTPTPINFWSDGTNMNGVRLIFRPEINMNKVAVGLDATIEIYRYDDDGLPIRKRVLKLSQGWQFFCKETRTFLRCDRLKPAYSGVDGGNALSDVDIKLDWYMLS